MSSTWPKARRLLDDAISTERGIAVKFDTWQIADSTRAIMYKIRDEQRRSSRRMFPDANDPNHGVSAYDALSLWISSTILRRNMTVTFHDEQEIEHHLSDLFSQEPEGFAEEKQNLFPGKCVTVKVIHELGESTVRFAPSFQTAWEILRKDFPAFLIMQVGYDASDLEITPL